MKSIENTYASGTMKVKDGHGKMVPFYPEMTTMGVYTGESKRLHESFIELNNTLSDQLNSTGVKVRSMPISESIQDSDLATTKNETLTAFTENDAWTLIVDTEATAAGERKTAVPFNLFNCDLIGTVLTVNWGDGSISNLYTGDYAQANSIASVHEYKVPGKYTVKIASSKWNYVRLLTMTSGNAISTVYNANAALYWFRRTLVKVCNAMPAFKSANCLSGTGSSPSISTSSVSTQYAFAQCAKLASIPASLFVNNPNISGFQGCFYNCSSLQSIPSGLFDNNAAATTFASCFYGCSSIESIPSNLFASNVAATTFQSCLYNCSLLTNFDLHIGSASVSNASSFVPQMSGTARQIYVPLNSTTYTTFNSIASSLGIAVIGE